MEELHEIAEIETDSMQEILDRIAQESQLSPEQIKALYEKCKEVIERVAQVIKEVWERIMEMIEPVIERFVAAAMDALLKAVNNHPKWLHLYRYAKKGRTRKKYQRLLMRQMVKTLVPPSLRRKEVRV